MNKILCCVIFLIFYNITIKAQDTMVLTARQQALSWIAALEAKGDVRQLYEVLDKALNERTLNVAEEKEALSQLYAYTGFPVRSMRWDSWRRSSMIGRLQVRQRILVTMMQRQFLRGLMP